MLATSYKNTIKILDIINDFTEITSIKLDIENICNIIFSPNNKILAIVSSDLISKIYILKDNVYFKTLDMKNSFSNIICFSPDSKYLASKINDHMIIIWDCDNNFDDFLTINIPIYSILSLNYSIDGNFLIVESNDGKIIFLNKLNNYSIVEELCITNASSLYGLILSPGGKFLAYKSEDIITLLDCNDNFHMLKTISILQDTANIFEFSLDDNFLSIGYIMGDILIIDCNNDFNQTRILNTDEEVENLCFSYINNDKMYLAAIFFSNIIKIFDCYDNFNQIYTLESINDFNLILFSPITSYGENFLILASYINKVIQVWDCNNNFIKKHTIFDITDGTVCFENEIKHTILW